MDTTNPSYYIIDVGLSRKLNVLCLWSCTPGCFTYSLDEAQRIPESNLIPHLEIYDNGDTTRAILCDRLHAYTGDPMDLIKPLTLPKGAETWLSQRFQKAI
jgi:hypothetical protein